MRLSVCWCFEGSCGPSCLMPTLSNLAGTRLQGPVQPAVLELCQNDEPWACTASGCATKLSINGRSELLTNVPASRHSRWVTEIELAPGNRSGAMIGTSTELNEWTGQHICNGIRNPWQVTDRDEADGWCRACSQDGNLPPVVCQMHTVSLTLQDAVEATIHEQ